MGIETLDLNDDGEGFTPIEKKPVEQKQPEKNVLEEVKDMDSTPISDLMPEQPVFQDQMMPPQQSQMVAPQQAAPQQAAPQPVPMMGSKYPFNLTEEQVESLLVGLVAVIGFSGPVQEKLAGMIPNFMESGNTSMIGYAVTGLLIAIMYFFVRRFAMKP